MGSKIIYQILIITSVVLIQSTKAVIFDEPCTDLGRFVHRDDDCGTYHLCSKLQDTFVRTFYKCPYTSIFNPTTQLCSLTGFCVQDICKNTSEIHLSDPNSNDCSSYIECVTTANFERYPVVRRCELGNYFNKELKTCGPETDSC